MAGTDQRSLVSHIEPLNPGRPSVCTPTDSEPANAHLGSEMKLFQRGLAKWETIILCLMFKGGLKQLRYCLDKNIFFFQE